MNARILFLLLFCLILNITPEISYEKKKKMETSILKWKNNRSYIITEIMKCAREVVNLTLLRDLKHIANKR